MKKKKNKIKKRIENILKNIPIEDIKISFYLYLKGKFNP